MHREFLENAGIDGSYLSIRVARGDAVAAIARLRAENFTGCNVTYPLKEEAVAACDALAEEARRAERGQHDLLRASNARNQYRRHRRAQRDRDAARRADRAQARIGVLGYGATARAILAELHDRRCLCVRMGARPGTSTRCVRPLRSRAVARGEHPRDRRQHAAPGCGSADRVARGPKRADVIIDVNYGPRATARTRHSAATSFRATQCSKRKLARVLISGWPMRPKPPPTGSNAL